MSNCMNYFNIIFNINFTRLDIDPNHTLILRNVQRNQEGNYSCHVKNSLGFDEIVYSLQIQGNLILYLILFFNRYNME